MNLLSKSIEIVDGDEEAAISFDSDSEAAIYEVQDLRRSISTTSFTSLQMSSQVKNSSATNLLIAPSVSACSVLETFAQNEINQMLVKPSTFNFTREVLQKRLQSLVRKSVKNFDGDVEVNQPSLNLFFFRFYPNFFRFSRFCQATRLKGLRFDTTQIREQFVCQPLRVIIIYCK